MIDIKVADKAALNRIELLYDKMIWLAKDSKRVNVLDMDDKYFNSVLKSMRIQYGEKFNLWERETRLRKVRQEYRASRQFKSL